MTGDNTFDRPGRQRSKPADVSGSRDRTQSSVISHSPRTLLSRTLYVITVTKRERFFACFVGPFVETHSSQYSHATRHGAL